MAPIAQLIVPGSPGRRVMIHQFVVEARPFTNCRVICFLGLLNFGGLNVTSQFQFIAAFRRATGIPEIDPVTGRAKGTNASDIVRTSQRLFPWVHVSAELVPDDDLLARVAAGEIQVSLSVWYGLLPRHLRRWSPNYTSGGPGVTDRHDGHEVRVTDARRPNGTWEVFFVDSLATGQFRGEWRPWAEIRPAVWGTPSRVFATFVEKGAALSTLIMPAQVFAVPAKVDFRSGTVLFDINLDAVTLAVGGHMPNDGSCHADMVVRVAQRPQRPPSGMFVHLVDGPAAGRYVRQTEVVVTSSPAAPATAEIAAATADLRAQVDAWKAYADAIAAVQRPVEEA